jgi:hypothetical protein
MYDATGGGAPLTASTLPVVDTTTTTTAVRSTTNPLGGVYDTTAPTTTSTPTTTFTATDPWLGFINIDPALLSTMFSTPVLPPVTPTPTIVPTPTPIVSPTIIQPPVSTYVPPIPYFAPPPPPPPPPPPIKVSTPQFVLFNDNAVPVEVMADLLFENIGGHELLTIARNDTVNGQSVAYQPIKNLNIIQAEFNPNNLIKLQQTSDRFFANFPIKLNEKIPNIGNGKNGSNVYLDASGNLIIEFINLANDEQVEVQITSNGTIYEVGE